MAIQTTGTVTYTHNSCPLSKEMRQGLITMMFLLVFIATVPMWLALFVHRAPMPMLCLFYLPFLLPLSVLLIWSSLPWSLTLDYGDKSYCSTFGLGPFTQRRFGSFTDISRVGIFCRLNKNALIIAFPMRFGKRTFWVESPTTTDDVTESAAILAAALGVPFSNAELKRGASERADTPFQASSNDCPTFTDNSTPFARGITKLAIRKLVTFAAIFLALSVLPFFFTGHERHNMVKLSIVIGVEFAVVIGWQVPYYYIYGEPWALTLDHGTRKYRLCEGFSPFQRKHSGTFEDLAGTRICELIKFPDGKPFLLTLSFKTRKDHKQFPFYQSTTRSEAERAFSEMRAVSGLGIADAWGNVLAPYEERFSSAQVVTYTHESIKKKYSRRRLTIEGIIKAVLPLAFTPLLFWNPVPGRSVGPTLFGVIAFGFWLIAALSLSGVTPWTLTLDYEKQEYEIIDGFAPFIWKKKTSFKSLVGVTILPSGDPLYTDPFRVAICVKRPRGKKYYEIEPAQTLPEATRRVDELSRRLGVPVVEPPRPS